MLLCGGGWEGFVFTLTLKAVNLTFNLSLQIFFFFFQVAKTLFNDEGLKPCPRCEHPARCHSVKGEGVCSRADCGFQFCTACLCAFHGSRECGSQSVGRRKKDMLLPGSAQSKRNIRRLWAQRTVFRFAASLSLQQYFELWWRWRLVKKATIYSQYMRAPSLLTNVSVPVFMSLYCINLPFSKVLTRVFLIMNVKEVSRAATMTEFCCRCAFFHTSIVHNDFFFCRFSTFTYVFSEQF